MMSARCLRRCRLRNALTWIIIGTLTVWCTIGTVFILNSRRGKPWFREDYDSSDSSENLKSLRKRGTSGEKSTFLLILILSAAGNIGQRDAIRRTWLQSSRSSDVPVFFSIGTVGVSAEVLEQLQVESNAHSDLMLLETLDTYSELTTKLIESFLWLDRRQIAFDFLLKVDDDSFVRLDKLLVELRSLKTYTMLYWGFFDGRARVKKSGPWVEPKFNSEDVSVGAWLGPLMVDRLHDVHFDTEYESRGCNNEFIITHKQNIESMTEKHENLLTMGRLCGGKETRIKLSYEYNWNVLPSLCCLRNNSSL